MKNLTYKIYTLGCKVNQYDSAEIGKQLSDAGFGACPNNADVAIVNTCAVTKTSVRKNKRMLNKARGENPHAKIILTGCWPKVYPRETEKFKLDLVVADTSGSSAGKRIIEFCEKTAKRKPHGILKPQFSNRRPGRGRSRYFLKIQDGCEQFCSYCVIPYARGPLKSRTEKEVLTEASQAIRQGYCEIVISGIHLGLYGKDLGISDGLAKLTEKLIRIKGLSRIRLSSIEITEVSSQLIYLMAKSKKICPHLHIPLQSGSDNILKAMNRPYDTKYFREKAEKINQAIPGVSISTDVIVGFPGEDEADFTKTMEFVKLMRFSRLHIFPFSAHEKTSAYFLPNQVSQNKKRFRADQLRKLGNSLANRYKSAFKDNWLEILVEKKRGGKVTGKTEYYFDLTVKSDCDIGEFVKVKI